MIMRSMMRMTAWPVFSSRRVSGTCVARVTRGSSTPLMIKGQNDSKELYGGAGDGNRTRIESLGISLPCQVIPADLRLACTVVHRC